MKFEWGNFAVSITVNDGWYGFTLSIVPFDWRIGFDKDVEGFDIYFGPLFFRIIYGYDK